MGAMPRASRYEIRLPKFKLQFKKSFKEMLTSMGLSRFFDDPELEKMLTVRSGGSPVVDDVMHEAVIEVRNNNNVV